LGKGYGKRILREGHSWIRANHPETQRIIAEIQPSNKISMDTFERAGFQKSHCSYIYHL